MKSVRSSMCSLVGVLALFTPVLQGAPPLKPDKMLRDLRASETQHGMQPAKANSNYTFTEIKYPDDGVTVFVLPYDINNSGIVSLIGVQMTGDEITILYDKGDFKTFRHPGSSVTSMLATNNGRLFGNWGDETQQTAGFYDMRTDTWTALPDVPEKNLNMGFRMNDVGAAVGLACENTWSEPTNCVNWTWDPVRRAYTFFLIHGDPQAQAAGINNRGEMVASHTMEFPSQSYRTQSGAWVPVLVPGALFVRARDINDRGQILMEFLTSLDESWIQAILYKSELRVLDNYPSAWLTGYMGMNDSGDAVGLYLTDSDYLTHSFVATRK